MENKETFTRGYAKDIASSLIDSVKVAMAICEIEFPGSKDILLDVMIGEMEKLRPEKIRADAGVCKNDTDKPTNAPKPANDLMYTADMMCSEDYKERFKAEYYQTKIRYDKLHNMCIKYEAGTLDFTPTCSLELLKEQKSAMGNYLRCLQVRAQIEDIEL